jgi:hypothetical protein
LTPEIFGELKRRFYNFTYENLDHLVHCEFFVYLFITYCQCAAEQRVEKSRIMSAGVDIYLKICNQILNQCQPTLKKMLNECMQQKPLNELLLSKLEGLMGIKEFTIHI